MALCNVLRIIEMPPDNEQQHTSGQKISSKMDVIDTALGIFEVQLKILDSAGLSMASIHLNDAIERLRSERVCLTGKLRS